MSTLIARLRSDEAGMTTAEYAVGTIGTCGVAGLLGTILSSDTARGWITGVLEGAWSAFFG